MLKKMKMKIEKMKKTEKMKAKKEKFLFFVNNKINENNHNKKSKFNI